MSEWRHLEAIVQSFHPSKGFCHECIDQWPCDAEQMRLRAERAEAQTDLALRQVRAIIDTLPVTGGAINRRAVLAVFDDALRYEAQRVLEGRESE